MSPAPSKRSASTSTSRGSASARSRPGRCRSCGTRAPTPAPATCSPSSRLLLRSRPGRCEPTVCPRARSAVSGENRLIAARARSSVPVVALVPVGDNSHESHRLHRRFGHHRARPRGPGCRDVRSSRRSVPSWGSGSGRPTAHCSSRRWAARLPARDAWMVGVRERELGLLVGNRGRSSTRCRGRRADRASCTVTPTRVPVPRSSS